MKVAVAGGYFKKRDSGGSSDRGSGGFFRDRGSGGSGGYRDRSTSGSSGGYRDRGSGGSSSPSSGSESGGSMADTLKNVIVAVAATEVVAADSENVVAVTVEAEVATEEMVALETAAAEEVVDSALKNVAAVAVEVAVLAVDVVVAVAAIDAIDLASRSGDKTVVQIRVKPHPHFAEIYQITLEDGAHRLATKSFAPGRSVYGERLIRFDGVEYRVWDAFRSKLAGAILKGLQIVPILPSHKVLYLGAASGTTPSHVSDIVGENGHVYCVEFAQRSLRELVTNVITYRPNMSPFLADARMPQKYLCSSPAKLTIFTVMLQRPSKLKFSQTTQM